MLTPTGQVKLLPPGNRSVCSGILLLAGLFCLHVGM
jgi:hypothetical protein